MKKQKQTREHSELCRGETFIITEMAVFTLEKYYLREPCYPLDDSRQIGNTSYFENGIVLILNEQSTWLLKTGLSVPDSLCTVPPSPQKKSEKGCLWGGRDCTQASLRWIIHF